MLKRHLVLSFYLIVFALALLGAGLSFIVFPGNI